jgi:hypothetical protein
MATIPVMATIAAGAKTLASWGNSVRDAINFLLGPPTAMCTNTAGTSLTTGTMTLIPMATENFDNDTMHDPTTNNSRMVFKTAGFYLVVCKLGFSANATGRRICAVRLNAAGSSSGGTFVVDAVTAPAPVGNTTTEVSFCQSFAANDYIEVFGQQDSGGNLALATGSTVYNSIFARFLAQ